MKIEKEILYRYFRNHATEEEERQVRRYVEESDENWNDYLRERKLFDAFVVRPRRKEELLSVKRVSKMRVLFAECAKIAAVAFLAFFVSYFYFHKKDDISVKSVVTTKSGQMAQVKLPDGTHVFLNANSCLEYPDRFSDEKREVRIDGEAYFEVARNEKKPFVVNTLRSKVRVLGTKFYVEDYAGSDISRTSLIEGSVEVAMGNKTVRLTPNQTVTLDNGKMVVSAIEDFETYRWREGLICLKNKEFTDVMKIFEKYYGVQIILSPNKKFKSLISGKFRLSDGVEHALRVLQQNMAFTYERDGESRKIEIQ